MDRFGRFNKMSRWIGNGLEGWAEALLARSLAPLLVDVQAERVMRVRFNCSNASSAITKRTSIDLSDVFEPLEVERRRSRCEVISGVGGKASCAWADQKERSSSPRNSGC